MTKQKKLFAFFGMLLLLAVMPSWQIAHGQTPQILDIGNLSATTIIVIIVGSSFGGLVRIWIPYARKQKARYEAIEAQQESGKPVTLQPLKFQKSFFYAWLLGVPSGSVLAIGFAASTGLAENLIGLIVNAIIWGLSMTWFVAEGQT
ncbi:MAG: hypothetical protein HZA82_05965 [Thaumarchaeota archaeon]|nr:hypothetical protein [Nitrososphaerota archaeon]